MNLIHLRVSILLLQLISEIILLSLNFKVIQWNLPNPAPL